jgi:hypothetical protein
MVRIKCILEPYIYKLAHKLFTLYSVWSTRVRPLSRGGSYFQDQDHVHPHISAAPTLGVCKNMLSTFYLSPTQGEDTKRLLGFSK